MYVRLFMRTFSKSAVIPLLASSLAGCGGAANADPGHVAAWETCGQVSVLDQFLQEKNDKIDYQSMLDDISNGARTAASADFERFGQLEVLVGRMRDSIDRGDPKFVIDLVAVENECKPIVAELP